MSKNYLFHSRGASSNLAFRHNGYIAPSAKTEFCIQSSEKYRQIIMNTYLILC